MSFVWPGKKNHPWTWNLGLALPRAPQSGKLRGESRDLRKGDVKVETLGWEMKMSQGRAHSELDWVPWVIHPQKWWNFFFPFLYLGSSSAWRRLWPLVWSAFSTAGWFSAPWILLSSFPSHCSRQRRKSQQMEGWDEPGILGNQRGTYRMGLLFIILFLFVVVVVLVLPQNLGMERAAWKFCDVVNWQEY